MVIATTAATAGVSSATTDGGIINSLLKIAFIVLILGGLIIALMWVTGSFSLSDTIDQITSSLKAHVWNIFIKYTPMGWGISIVSGAAAVLTGTSPKANSIFGYGGILGPGK